MHENLKDEAVLQRAAELIARQIRPVIERRAIDLVLLYRAPSSIETHIQRLARRLKAAIAAQRLHHFAGIYISRLETSTYYGRQVLTTGLVDAVRMATLLDGPMERMQPELFQASANLMDERRILLVYVDNGAVTGHAIAELLLSVANLEDPYKDRIVGVQLFPLVTRLSPVEEALLQHSDILVGRARNDRIANPRIPIRFGSLVQLRMRSHRTLEEVAVVRRLRDLVSDSLDADVVFSEIRHLLKQSIGTIEQLQFVPSSQTGAIVTSPIIPDLEGSREFSVSDRAINFRQLLALRQQGVPCTFQILEVFRQIAERSDRSVLTVLALEPEILLDDALVTELGSDIVDLCILTAETSGDRLSVANAIWVLAHFPVHLSRVVPHLRSNAAFFDFGVTLLAFLCIYGLKGSTKFGAIGRLVDELDRLGDVGSAVSTQIEAVLKAEVDFDASIEPWPTSAEAYRQVRQFLTDATYRHGVDDFSQWLRVRTAIETMSKGTDPLPAIARRAQLEAEAIRGAEAWTLVRLRPLFSALHVLTTDLGLPDSIRAILRSKARGLKKSLMLFASAAPEFYEGRTELKSVASAWEAYLSGSISLCSSELYADPGASFPESVGLSKTKFDRKPPLEAALVFIVNEPISLLCGSALAMLDPTLSLRLNIQVEDFQLADHVVTVQELRGPQEFLIKLWLRTGRLPVLWVKEIRHYLSAVRILFENIKRYGRPGHAITINIHLEHTTEGDSEKKSLRLRFENEKRPGEEVAPGNSRGMPELKACLGNLSGDFSIDKESQNYSITIWFPIDCIHMKVDRNERRKIHSH